MDQTTCNHLFLHNISGNKCNQAGEPGSYKHPLITQWRRYAVSDCLLFLSVVLSHYRDEQNDVYENEGFTQTDAKRCWDKIPRTSIKFMSKPCLYIVLGYQTANHLCIMNSILWI